LDITTFDRGGSDSHKVVRIGNWGFSQFEVDVPRYGGGQELSWWNGNSSVYHIDMETAGRKAAKRCFDSGLKEEVIRAEYTQLESTYLRVLEEAEKRFGPFKKELASLCAKWEVAPRVDEDSENEMVFKTVIFGTDVEAKISLV
jgi:hypothetical protein